MKKGFTLIELLIVIAVLAVLAIAVLSAINPIEQINRGRDTAVLNSSSELYTAFLRVIALRSSYDGVFLDKDVSGASLDSPDGQMALEALTKLNEIKKSFFSGKQYLSQVYISADAHLNNVAVCFKPVSGSFTIRAENVYDKFGQRTDCGWDCYTCFVEGQIDSDEFVGVEDGDGEVSVLQPTPNPTFAVFETSDVPILVLKYMPADPSNPSLLNTAITGPDLPYGTTIDQVRQKTESLGVEVANFLTDASAYHKYKDEGARPSLRYFILDSKEYLEPVPTINIGGQFPANHVVMLKDKGFDICDYVENKGVKEVWVWMYHSRITYPVESYQIGPYGGLGNGYMDLPLCAKTYRVYDYNFGRGIGEAVEDHTHHLEALFRSVNNFVWGGKFVGGCGGGQVYYRCGWTHYPPNVMQYCSGHDYDWRNEAVVSSDCEDWKADGSGDKKQVSCHTWAGAVCGNDSGDRFKKWWMQNIPPGWWVFIGDYDGARAGGANLY